LIKFHAWLHLLAHRVLHQTPLQNANKTRRRGLPPISCPWLQAIKSKFNFCANADRNNKKGNNNINCEDNAKETGRLLA